jgi:cyclopropane-fatty-acyl-phospholipid synthase
MQGPTSTNSGDKKTQKKQKKQKKRAPIKLMDIGSGWGYLVHAASQRGYEATGLCNCKSMVALAQQKYGQHLFQDMDYRDIPASHDLDAITSVEMIEAVPQKHYKDFVAACDRGLKPGGRVVMQVINALGFNNPVARSRNTTAGGFVTTHIFPGQQLPNLEFLHEAFLDSGKFRRTYSETAGHDYERTLAEWSANLRRNRKTVPERVYRKYQVLCCFCCCSCCGCYCCELLLRHSPAHSFIMCKCI